MKCPNCSAEIPDDAEFCPECGARQQVNYSAMQTVGGMETQFDGLPTASPTDAYEILSPGTVFADRYAIEGTVGQGGMGVVYKAKDEVSGEPLALKLIRPERLSGDVALKRLIDEGITTRKLRHPNIVAVYDVGVSDGQPYVSMEYVEGLSLRSWHREKIQAREDIPLRVAARIIAEILDGLKAAHEAGVIHRDLKPENIILLQEPDDKRAPLRILDFGIARATDASTKTGTGTGLGTPRYMSPEQVTNPDTATPAADLYSLSVLFYELLVDVLPQGHWQPPSGGRSDVPPGIDQLIEQGLSNRPSSRPQSAEEYRARLVAAVNMVVHDPGKSKTPVSDGSSNAGFPKWAIWAGAGGSGFVLLMIMLAAIPWGDDGYLPQGPCDHLFGAAYDQCLLDNSLVFDSGGVDDGGSNPPPPPPPPNPFENLSGPWTDQWGTYATVSVDRNGRMSGSGRGPDGTSFNMSGQLSRSSTMGRLSVPAFRMTLDLELRWDGGCHVDYVTYNPDGSVNAAGRYHANHAPGAPCP
jgi:serine/threonine protein kinase